MQSSTASLNVSMMFRLKYRKNENTENDEIVLSTAGIL